VASPGPVQKDGQWKSPLACPGRPCIESGLEMPGCPLRHGIPLANRPRKQRETQRHHALYGETDEKSILEECYENITQIVRCYGSCER